MDCRRRREARDGVSRSLRRATGLASVAVLLLCLLAGSATAATYDAWSPLKSGTTRTLYSVAFVTADEGWAVGAGGVIRHTANAGTTWSGQTSGVTQNLRAVVFADADNGWIVGDGGVVLRTANGGAKWTRQPSGTTSALYALCMLDTQQGWAVGGAGTIIHTVNGGATWTKLTSGTTQTLNAVGFGDGTHGWVGGNRGVQLRTTNAGASWTMLSLGKKQTLYAVLFSDANDGWETGSGGAVRHTANGGSTWSALNSGTRSALYSIAVNGTGGAWVVGGGGTIRYSGDGGATWSPQTSGTTVNLRDIARSGRNVYAVGDGGTIVASIADLAPPATTAAGLQADKDSGWRNTAVTVTLTASDARSGVAATYYTIDGGSAKTYTGAFTVSAPGQHHVTYWSVDKVGNVEAIRNGWINIDTTLPTVADNADVAWHNAAVTVTLSPSDAGGSGVAVTEYRLQGETAWRATTGDAFTVPAPAGGGNDGVHAYEYRAVDGAGNASAPGTCTVKIDTIAAETASTALFDKLTGWSTSDRLVTLTAADTLSGVAATYYTVDGGAQLPYTAAFTVLGPGQHPVTYWSVDQAGNVEAVRTGWVNIASFFAEAAGLAPDTQSYWRNTGTTVTITGGGSNAPFTISYQLDGGPWQTVASPASFAVDGVGNHTVVYYASDAFATASATLTGHVNIETTPPTTTATPVPSGWKRSDIVVPLVAVDDLSGVAATCWHIDSGAWTASSEVRIPALPDHSMDGVHAIGYYSKDAAGNQEAARKFTARIDTRRPGTRAPYAASVIRGRYATLKCKIVDAKPCATKATLKLVVKNSRNVVKWQHKYTSAKVNVLLAKRFLCKLAPGKYRFFVYATDRAGNVQTKVAYNRLTVR